MALILADRVKETTTVTGTQSTSPTATLLGAVTGFQAFATAMATSSTTYYCIAGQGVSEWEVGIGTLSASATLTRAVTPLSSSNAGASVNFSAGTKDVFVSYPASKSVDLSAKDASGGVAGLTGFKLNLKNAANTFTNFLTNATTAARTWTFPDKDGIVALIGDVLPNVTNVFSNAVPNNITNVAGIQAVALTADAHLLLLSKGNGGVANYIPTALRPLGNSSATFGSGNTVSGNSSAAFGDSNTASGDYSAAFGDSNTASGNSSATFGSHNTVSGYASAAFGSHNTASGNYSATFGSSNTAIGASSATFGSGNTVSGNYSTIFGVGNTVSGYSSAAFGIYNTASADYSAAFGNSNKASGISSAAFGNGSNTGTSDNITNNKISATSGAQDQMSGFTPLQVSVGSVGDILSASGIYDAGAYNNATTFCLTANSSSAFDITVVARSDNHTSFAAWKVLGLVSVNATGTATLYGVTVTTISNAPAWSFTSANIVANSNVPNPLATSTAFGGFNITTPGSPGATTVSWGATIISTEVII